MMLFTVTLISLLVHIYSTEYLNDDRRFTHYFAFLSLFTASMLPRHRPEHAADAGAGWELVGVCSFVLIGHWWEEKPNTDAALKAFLTNRVGDIGLILGVIILFFAAGAAFDVLEINALAADGRQSHLVLLMAAMLAAAAVCSKSGQFPLHTWLPDAMAGPTPVSALHPRRHHGRRRRVPDRPPVPGLLRGPRDRLVVDQPAGAHRRLHHAHRSRAGLRPARHQEGARLLDHQPARLHGHGPRRRAPGRRRVPPLHPRHVQGLPVPRRRLGQPRRPPHVRHAEDGRAAQVHAQHVHDLHHRLAGAGRHLPVGRVLVEGRDPGRRRPGPGRRPTG